MDREISFTLDGDLSGFFAFLFFRSGMGANIFRIIKLGSFVCGWRWAGGRGHLI